MTETKSEAFSEVPKNWRRAAADLQLPTQHFIDGIFRSGQSGDMFETSNPATGAILAALPQANRNDVDEAVAVARSAYEKVWRAFPTAGRKQILFRLADLVETHGDELALLDSIEMGKAISQARAEIPLASGLYRFYAEALDKITGDLLVTGADAISFSRPEPRGVIGAIIPWNFPLANASIKIAPALAAGNTMVLKPSEISSLSALRLAELACEAGLPAGVLNVVTGQARTGEFLASHRDIDLLSFTGSTMTGRRLLELSGMSNGKPLILECGGKSAQIVTRDMSDDIIEVAKVIAHEAFWNIGQWCAARTRVIVDNELFDPLVSAIAQAARYYVPGDPMDGGSRYGVMASTQQFEKVQLYIEDAKKAGYELRLDGTKSTPLPLSVTPSIFTDVPSHSALWREEIFGPVLAVRRVSNFSAAIEAVNDSDYGLGATVWTRNLEQAFTAAREIRSGKIIVRGSSVSKAGAGLALGAEPWGASGFGMERGLAGLLAYSRAKAVEMFI